MLGIHPTDVTCWSLPGWGTLFCTCDSLRPYICTIPQVLKATLVSLLQAKGKGWYPVISLVSLTSFVTYQGNKQLL